MPLASISGDDGPRDDIAGCEFGGGMVARHEPPAIAAEEHGAFATNRLGDEEGWLALEPEGGGMELVELEVHHLCARFEGKDDAIAGGDIGIGRVRIEVAGATRCQHDTGRGVALGRRH